MCARVILSLPVCGADVISFIQHVPAVVRFRSVGVVMVQHGQIPSGDLVSATRLLSPVAPMKNQIKYVPSLLDANACQVAVRHVCIIMITLWMCIVG